jgi:hypothetical protein
MTSWTLKRILLGRPRRLLRERAPRIEVDGGPGGGEEVEGLEEEHEEERREDDREIWSGMAQARYVTSGGEWTMMRSSPVVER